MPYELKRVPGGWKVFKQGTNTSYSDKALPRHRAEAQMRALYAAESQSHVAADPEDAVNQHKVSKVSVNYRPSTSMRRSCGACTMYSPSGVCSLVAGHIEPDMVCDRFSPKHS